MSVASVVKYSMTLDGAQYMQELRRAIAETKAAEEAIRRQNGEMTKISISAAEVNAASSRSAKVVNDYALTMNTASEATKGFNALQSAYSNAMGGNFIGATKSATVAVKALWAVMLANPLMLIVGVLGAAVAALYSYSKKLDEAVEARNANISKLAEDMLNFKNMFSEIEGTDEVSVYKARVKVAIDRNDENALADLQEEAASKAEAARKKAEEEKLIYAGMVQNNGYAGQNFSQEEIDRQKQAVEENAKEWAKWRDIVRDVGTEMNRIGEAKLDAEAEVAEKYKKALDDAKAQQDAIWSQRANDSFAADAAELEKGTKESGKKQADEKQAEKDKLLKDVENAEAAAAAAKERADNAAKANNEAMAKLLHPGAKEKADKKIEQEAQRERNRFVAAMSGNSVEAKAARAAFEKTALDALDALDASQRAKEDLKDKQAAAAALKGAMKDVESKLDQLITQTA